MTRSSVDNPTAAAGVSPAEIPSSDAIAGITESGSVNGANSTNVTEHVLARLASSVAIVVLPAPPGPSNVTNRARVELLAEVGEHVVTADDRRQAVRDAADPALVVLARRFHRRRDGPQRRILGEDPLFQLAELRTRLESELVDQHAARRLERAQRLDLATLAVLRRHQQRPPVLVDRFGDDERFELAARRVEVLVGVHLDLEPAGPRRPCNSFEAHALAAAEVGVGDVVVRTAAHERLSRTQQASRFGGVSVGVRRAPSEQLLELLDVDRVVGDGERVAPTVRLIFAGEMSLRSLDIWAWIAFAEGGRPGHKTSASRSADTGAGAAATSAASSRRFCTPRGVTSMPSPSRTTSGPRTSNRTVR